MPAATLEPGIDPAWLDTLAEGDPVRHAYALWDRRYAPDRTEFVTLREGGRRSAYFLIWKARPELPVVHWVGSPKDPKLLLDALPPRPLIAVVPEGIGAVVAKERGPATVGGVRLMDLRKAPVDGQRRDGSARRLTVRDAPMLRGFATENFDPLTSTYMTANLEQEWVFGALEGKRLVATARAQAVTPGAWIIGGVYTAPSARGRGHGTAVTRAAVDAALAAGARPGLFVREENVPARRIYEGMGFATTERCAWIDASAGLRNPRPPSPAQRSG